MACDALAEQLSAALGVARRHRRRRRKSNSQTEFMAT
jgi:hypothetical protein